MSKISEFDMIAQNSSSDSADRKFAAENLSLLYIANGGSVEILPPAAAEFASSGSRNNEEYSVDANISDSLTEDCISVNALNIMSEQSGKNEISPFAKILTGVMPWGPIMLWDPRGFGVFYEFYYRAENLTITNGLELFGSSDNGISMHNIYIKHGYCEIGAAEASDFVVGPQGECLVNRYGPSDGEPQSSKLVNVTVEGGGFLHVGPYGIVENIIIEPGGTIEYESTRELSCSPLPSNARIITVGPYMELDGGSISGYGIEIKEDNLVFCNNTRFSSGGGIFGEVSAGENYEFYGNAAVNGGAVHGHLTAGAAFNFYDNKAKTGGAVFGALTLGDLATFTNNSADKNGGAIYSDDRNILGSDCLFQSNFAGEHGGAIYNYDWGIAGKGEALQIGDGAQFIKNTAGEDGGAVYGELTAGKNAKMESNFAGFNGGALYCRGYSIFGDGAAFNNNSATENGGAIYGEADFGNDAEFLKNTAITGNGGAICLTDYDQTFIEDRAIFQQNSAGSNGGAIAAISGSVILGKDTYFNQNIAQNNGGAIYGENSEIYIDSATSIVFNSAGHGGAIYITDDDLTLCSDSLFRKNNAYTGNGGAIFVNGDARGHNCYDNVLFVENNAAENGGAIYVEENLGEFNFGEGVRFEKNTADKNGGAIYMGMSGYLGNGTSFSDNTALDCGGAVYVAWGSAEMTNASLKGNHADQGGAIYNKSNIYLSQCVFEDNTADTLGGAFYNTGFASLEDVSFVSATDSVCNTGELEFEGQILLGSDLISYGADATIYNEGTITIKGMMYLDCADFNNCGILSFDLTTREDNKEQYFLNDWSELSTKGYLRITVDDKQDEGEYILIDDAEHFFHDVTVYTDDGEYLGRLDWTAGSAFLSASTASFYLFKNEDNNLVLSITPKDITPPAVVVDGISYSWAREAVISFNVTDTQSGVKSFEYSLDGSEWFSGTTVTVTECYTDILYRAEDNAGNVTDGRVYVNWVDDSVPVIKASADKTEPTNSAVTVTAAAEDYLSGIKTVEYSLDNITWQSGTSVVCDENQIVYFRAIDGVGYISETSYSVENIDKKQPVISVYLSETGPVNDGVYAIAEAVDDTSECIVEYSFDQENWIVGDAVWTTENGMVFFRAADAAGNMSFESISVENIDHEQPVISFTLTPDEWTPEDVLVCADVTDNKGVESVEFSIDGKNWVAGKNLLVNKNCTVYCRAIDTAGNETISEIVVDNIDKENPLLDISPSTVKWTAHNVVINAFAGDNVGIDSIEYSFDAVNWIEGDTVSVLNNGTIHFRTADFAGNTCEALYIVDNIDMNAPQLQIFGIPYDYINKPVRISAEASDAESGLKTIEYRIGQNKWKRGSSVKVTENCSISFRAIDNVGNVAEETVVIDKIDKIPPVITVIPESVEKNFTGFKIAAEITDNTVIKSAVYKINTGAWKDYTGSIRLNEYDVVTFEAVDRAGNSTQKQYLFSQYYFVKSNFSDKINQKKQDGFLLFYQTNAFNSLNDLPRTQQHKIVMLDNITLIDDKTDITDIVRLQTSAVRPSVSNGKNKSSYSLKISSKRTLNIQQKDCGGTQFHYFSKVNISDGAVISEVIGGGLNVTANESVANKKEITNVTTTDTENQTASGNITISGSTAELIRNYSNVTVNNSEVKEISNKVSKSSSTSKLVNGNLQSASSSKSHYAAGKVTLNNGSSVDLISGFKTVNLLSSTVGKVESGVSFTQKISVKNNEESSTVTNTRNGSLTAVDSKISYIDGYSNIKLTGSTAGDIYQTDVAKIVDGVETKKLVGSVNMISSVVGSVENFASMTMVSSIVDDAVTNVAKLNLKGLNSIGSFVGTSGNDTLTINRNAVLSIGSIDFLTGPKDKLVNNGTLVLSKAMDITALPISGKGEIAAVNAIWQEMKNTDILNLGETVENFRGTAYENADDTWKKAVKWDGEEMFSGWMGGWEGYKSDRDCIDHIRFKADAEDTLSVTGVDGDSWTLLDKKGNEINDNSIFDGNQFRAAGEYILQINSDKDESFAYSINLA